MNGFLILATAWAALQAPPPVLTLDDAMRIAEERAFSLQLAESEVEKQRQRVAENRGGLGPRVQLGGTYTRYDREISASAGPGTSFVVQPIDSTRAQATVSLPIDISGNVKRIVDAARASLAASEANLVATKNDLMRDVQRDYLNVLQAQSLVEVAEQDVRNSEEQLADARKRFEAGASARVEVVRFEAQLAQAQADRIATQNAFELSKKALNNTLGRPIETDFVPAPIETLPEFQKSDEELIGTAMERRAELEAFRQQLRALGLIAEAEGRGLDPTLGVGVTHSRNFGETGFGGQNHQTIGVVEITWPIFDSGVTQARRRAARQDEKQALIRYEQARLGVSLEVRQAATTLRNAIARLDVAEKRVDLAEESYRLAQVRYRAGEGVQLEVIDAQTELTRARVALIGARYDYLAAYAELRRAIGGIDPAAASERLPASERSGTEKADPDNAPKERS